MLPATQKLPPTTPAQSTSAAANFEPPTPPQLPPRTYYDLRVRLDTSDRVLDVRETVLYPNATGESLSELVMVIPSTANRAAIRLKAIAVDGQPLTTRIKLEGNRLEVPLPQPLHPGGVARLELVFDLKLPRIGAYAMGFRGGLGWTERQINLVNWYAIIPPYRPGVGWIAHPDHVVGEYMAAETSDHQIEVTLDGSGFSVLAPGQGHFAESRGRFEHETARGFVWTAARGMQSESQETAGVVVESHFFSEHRAAGEAVLKTAVAALELYTRLFGPYPHERFVVVEGDFLDGLEADGLIFVGRDYYEAYNGTPGSYLVTITAHEVAHQWWYGLVGNDPAMEPWLDEALATYSEALYYEYVQPELLDWWWAFRVERYAPTGRVGSTIFEFESFRPYANAVYLRGAQFMASLRSEMGDETFFVMMRAYLATFKGQIASTTGFWEQVSASGVRANALNHWYFQEEGQALPDVPEQTLLEPISHEYQRWNSRARLQRSWP